MQVFRNCTSWRLRLVWLTLLAWSFALASGVVNACVLSLPGRTAEGSGPSAQAGAATHTRFPEGIGSHGAEDRGAGASARHPPEHEPGTATKDTCLKFCADESSAVAKSPSPGADMGAALVEPRIDRRLAVPSLQADPGSLPEAPRAQGPPLVIRFLRLTL